METRTVYSSSGCDTFAFSKESKTSADDISSGLSFLQF
uniref:Uncharacterized protein n=1 Tax=Anguilla anguilla TaxID=7936 RepID=A0A0E9WAS4_ANGAN